MSKHFQVVENGVCVNVVASGDDATLVDNAIHCPGEAPFPAPAGTTLMAQEGACIGWTLADGVLSPPVRA